MVAHPPPEIDILGFKTKFQSLYLKALRLEFEQNGTTRQFDLALRHSSVAILLYHTGLKQFLTVRQFRPAIFHSRVMKLPENASKTVDEVVWSKYDREIGCTRELCAGLLDKDKSLQETAREEIMEECGYDVRAEEIMHISSFLVGMDESGSPQHLFYAEIDDDKKISEGGGNASEGEIIFKVWLTEAEARSLLLDPEYSSSPPGFTYAFQWWFDRCDRGIPPTDKYDLVDWPVSPETFPIGGPHPPMESLRFSSNPQTNRFHPLRILYAINGISRSWDVAPCENSSAVLIYNRKKDVLLMNQRFRPASLIGRGRHMPESKGRELSALDWSSVPHHFAYTLELCSGHLRPPNETNAECAVRNVALKSGYRITQERLRKLGTFILGISQGGDSLTAYFVEVADEDAIEDFRPFEDVLPIEINRDEAEGLLRARLAPGSPAILFALRWFLTNLPHPK